MPTISINFTFAVKACHFGVEEDIIFLFYTQLTFSTHRWVWFPTVHQLPWNRVFNFSFFEVPNMVAQGCLVGFWVFKGVFVHPKPGLKCGGGQANVGVRNSICLVYCGLVHWVPDHTFTPKWTGWVFTTVAGFFFFNLRGGKNFCILGSNQSLQILGATVAYFKCISVEYFFQNVPIWEALVNNFQKFCGHICLYTKVKWWVDPNDVPFSISGFISGFCCSWTKF